MRTFGATTACLGAKIRGIFASPSPKVCRNTWWRPYSELNFLLFISPKLFIENPLTYRVIADKTAPPKEFSQVSRTADSDQKAWRKRQLIYKLSKRGTVTQAVTDIILCSKLKVAPDGFKLAGDINGVLICYKTSAIPVRLSPPVPGVGVPGPATCEVEQALNRLNLQGQRNSRGPVSGGLNLLLSS